MVSPVTLNTLTVIFLVTFFFEVNHTTYKAQYEDCGYSLIHHSNYCEDETDYQIDSTNLVIRETGYLTTFDIFRIDIKEYIFDTRLTESQQSEDIARIKAQAGFESQPDEDISISIIFLFLMGVLLGFVSILCLVSLREIG